VRSTPRIVMTLVARDEVDILDAMIRFHLSAGVDFIVAFDNGSTDGTLEILEGYAKDERLHLIRKPQWAGQEEMVTELARMAASEFEADWVINADADEFWWPLDGNLKDVLGRVPRRFGKILGPWCHFPPRPANGYFADRMTTRIVVAQPPRWNAHVKVAHRADLSVEVAGGNHDASGPRVKRARKKRAGIEVLHFPFRSYEQFEQKFARWCELLLPWGLAPRYHEAHVALTEGRMRELWESYVVTDDELESGLRDGTFAIDTRLCDALQSMSQGRTAIRAV
jgi:hypothetical protein